jgi:hypothetical protein
MSLTFIRARDVVAKDLHYLVGLYGDSGAGKTWLAASAPRPVVLLTEQNGEQSLRLSNPEASYVVAKTFEDVRDFLRLAQDGSLREQGFESLVIDGLTEVQQLIRDEISARKGGDEFTIADWGELTDKMRKLMRLLRTLASRYHVVCTMLSEEEFAGEVKHVRPAFQGKKLANEVMQFFSAVGYVFKRPAKGEDSGVEHVAMFDGPSRIKAKNCHPLRGSRPGPISDWIEDLRSGSARNG